jgi:integrase
MGRLMARPRRTIPWLTKRDEVFYANWYEPAKGETPGRTRSVSMGTTEDTEARLRFSAFLAKGPVIFSAEERFRGVSVCDCLDEYELGHVNKHVIDKVRQLVAIKHLKKFFVGSAMRDVDVAASRGYANARRDGVIGGGKGRAGDLAKGSDSTICRELRVLRAAANYALKMDRLKIEELPRLDLPREPAPEEALFLTKPEVDAIHEAAEGPLADFIALTYFTASRRRAIQRLKVGQIDLVRGRINLRAPGEKATKKRRPIVPMHPKIEPICRRLVSEAREGWLFGPTIEFYSPFRKVCGKVGIDDKRAHPHVLRHSRATHLLQDGVSIFNVASLLGDSIQTVSRVYAHSCPDILAAAIGDD